MVANQTMRKFGYPESLIREYQYWAILLRPAQVTLGSLVLAAKSDVVAFGQLPPGAYAELATVTREIETVLLAEVDYAKINYLMLMMVDPHVHFHVIPRYQEAKTLEGVTIGDAGWPGPPDLKTAPDLDGEALERLRNRFQQSWLNIS